MQIRQWIRAHPWQALGRGLWVLFNAAWGAAALGFVAWGPLVAGPAVVALLALLGALLHGIPWAWQSLAAIRGRTRVARRWRWVLLATQLAILLAVGTLSLVQLYGLGTLSLLPEDRVARFEHLWRAMDRHYVYFDLKGIDWQAVHLEYRPRVEAAQDEGAYFTAIAEMLYTLNDTHTDLASPLLSSCCYALTREIEGQAVVTASRSQAEEAGIVRGSLILAVDGQPLAEALLVPKLQWTNASTPWRQRHLRFLYLLTIPPEGPLEVTFETPAGERRTATLIPATSPAGAAATSDREPLIAARRLPSGIGVIKIPTLGSRSGHDLVAEFDAALNELIDAPGILLDLRGNGGGSSALGDAMAGRLIDTPYTYGVERYRVRTPLRAWRAWAPYQVEPRPPVYRGPVAVLIDTEVVSSAEMMVVALVDSGRAVTVGRPTAGASGNPVFFPLAGRGVTYSTGAFYRNDGTLLEGAGIRPDVPMTWTIEAFRAGQDPDMEAAEEWLLATGER